MTRMIWWAVLAAVAARLFVLLVIGDPLLISKAATAWDWGYEQAAVGRALARGDGFADAFGRGTGPTGWAAPVYPMLLAVLSKIFGGAGEPMAWALALLQIGASSLTCFALAALAHGLGRKDLMVPVAWVWALYPSSTWFAVTLVWDSTLVALGVVVWLAALTGVGRGARPRSAFRLGCGLGALALINPAPLAFAPVAVPWLRFRMRPILALVGGTALVLAPWVLRNWISVGSPGLRTNLGVELMVGNNDLAEGKWVAELHPAYAEPEAKRYARIGEAAYSAEAQERALDWIEKHPERFAELCGIRFMRFWVGLGPLEEQRDWMGWVEWIVGLLTGIGALTALFTWRGGQGSGWIVRGVVLLFPLVYVATHVLPRYRFPIDGVVVLLSTAVLIQAWERLYVRRD